MSKQFHEVAELFPLMQGTAFEELVADIKKNGLREPILLDGEGRILDGRNRYRACQAAGVEPQFVEWKGEGSLTELALSLNLKRRHLDESQRALVAARLAKMMESKRLGKRRAHYPADLQGSALGESRVQAGALVNISPRLISYAIRTLRDGCEELVAAVESGQLPVSTAARLAGLPKAEQTQFAAGGLAEMSRKARELCRGKKPAAAAETWPFGVVKEFTPGVGGDPGVVFLWVATGGLTTAVEALKARGLRYEPLTAG